MKYARIIGLGLFLFAFGLFVLSITFSTHTLNEEALKGIDNQYHRAMIKKQAGDSWQKEYDLNYTFGQAMQPVLKRTQQAMDSVSGVDPEKGIWNATNLPEGVSEWEYRMGDDKISSYTATLMESSATSMVKERQGLYFFLIFILGTIGALMYILAGLQKLPGIKHDHIYHSSLQKGLIPVLQMVLVAGTLIATGWVMYTDGALFYFVCTALVTIIILTAILLYEAKERKYPWMPTPSSIGNGWLGVALGTFLILFYIVLYFYPQYITNWVILVEPIKQFIWNDATVKADRWFLYGFLYTLIMIVMGIRMFVKYRHNRYQLIRTASVIFFQLSFAFLLPELLGKFNNPAVNLTTAWPLDYSFYYDYRLNGMLEENKNYFLGMNVGTMMFVWGVALTLIVVPLFTYLYGKRWYCSWVCGCGGLAETLGDPFRQQSDKSLRAWRIERFVIHGVMVFVIIMTALQIYQYFVNPEAKTINLGFYELDIYSVRKWYGFLIGSVFAGVVGTGFYPLMGNRMWCRYGCPLAGLMGLVQRFKSRFRITTNGGQCISCGNCSTYCEMGIDVRHYAQRGQDIVRASCVGCGVCSAVCPRGVLRLENGPNDGDGRTMNIRNIHIEMDEIEVPH